MALGCFSEKWSVLGVLIDLSTRFIEEPFVFEIRVQTAEEVLGNKQPGTTQPCQSDDVWIIRLFATGVGEFLGYVLFFFVNFAVFLLDHPAGSFQFAQEPGKRLT